MTEGGCSQNRDEAANIFQKDYINFDEECPRVTLTRKSERKHILCPNSRRNNHHISIWHNLLFTGGDSTHLKKTLLII